MFGVSHFRDLGSECRGAIGVGKNRRAAGKVRLERDPTILTRESGKEVSGYRDGKSKKVQTDRSSSSSQIKDKEGGRGKS